MRAVWLFFALSLACSASDAPEPEQPSCLIHFDTAEQIGAALGRYVEYVPSDSSLGQPAIRVVTTDFKGDPTELLERSIAQSASRVATFQFDHRGVSPMRAKQAFEKMLIKWAFLKQRISKKPLKQSPELIRLNELYPDPSPLELENLVKDYRYSLSERGQIALLVITQGLGYLFYPTLAWVRVHHSIWDWLLLGFFYTIPEVTKVYVGSEILLYPSQHHKRKYQIFYPLLTRAFQYRKQKITDKLTQLTQPNLEEPTQGGPLVLVIDRLYSQPIRDSLLDLGYTEKTEKAQSEFK